MPSIQISKRTYTRLQNQAQPFDDTPDSVIGRLLDRFENDHGSEAPSAERDRERARAQVGTILPEKEYWIPILQVLDDRGGRAPSVEAIDRVGELMKDRLLDADREEISTGETRWRNRTQFARLRMKERGLLASDSPRGIWEITDKGRTYLDENG